MDIRMPDLDGIEATETLVRSGSRARVLVLTTFDLDEYVYRAMRAGASGFLLKDSRREELSAAVRVVNSGETLLAPTITRRLIEDFCRRPLPGADNGPAALLSARELDVVRELATGRSNAEIADRLLLGESTVKSHIAHILTKLGLRDRVQIVVFAYEHGLASPGQLCMAAAICVFAFLVIVFVSQSARIDRVYLNGPIIFIVAGGVVGRTLVDSDADGAAVRGLAEVALLLVLFHDAAELQPRELRSDSVFTGRLLLIGLPLTIAAGYLLARGLFPDIGGWLALLVAAAVAPTDAGLGAATVLNPVVPARVRRILNVESGLNDGLVTPVVLLAVAAAAGVGGESSGHRLLSAVLDLAVGVVIGVVIGYAAGRLVELARDRGWAEVALLPIATLACPLLCYYGAHEVGANGFIAAFTAGAAYAASQKRVRDLHESMALIGLTSTFLGYAIWMVFGVVAATHLRPLVSWQNLLFAVLSLTVLRMGPVALSLLGSGLRPQTVAFVGWFGPRGLASIIFALIAYESLGAQPAVSRVLSVIGTTVVLSVLAHGLTALPWAQRYGAWARRSAPGVESADAVEPLRRHGSSLRSGTDR